MSRGTDFVRYALSIGAIELVPRKLKSGRESPYFFNSGLFNDGESLSRFAGAYTAAINRYLSLEVIFGLAEKGTPIAIAVAMSIKGNIGWAFNRKEEKGHGERGTIIGASLPGKKVLIVDDVITTGGSCEKAVNIVREAGGLPIGCVIAFDRQERGKESALSAVQEFEQKYQIPVRAAATLTDLIEVLSQTAPAHPVLPKILEYKARYGVILGE